MTEAIIALLAAFTAAVLARRLCGDHYGALVAGVAYAMAPSVRFVISSDPRSGLAIAALPVLFILFYRLNDLHPTDTPAQRKGIAALALTLGVSGLFDPRLTTVSAFLLWLALGVSYFLDKARRGEVWGPPFKGLAWATVFGVLTYLPFWFARRSDPTTLGGAYPAGMNGADLTWLLTPSYAYVGISLLALIGAALTLTRSYRAQAKLWTGLGLVLLWAGLGAKFSWGGHYIWWIPALYKGLARMGPLGGVPPEHFSAIGHLAFALVAGYGFGGLLTQLSPRAAAWLRPAACTATSLLLALDFLRYR
jgi:hypothetical protein